LKKVFLDLSAALDLLLNRPPWAADMAAIWTAHRQGRIDALLAAFSVPTLFYIVRRQTDLATSKSAVQDCVATLTIAPVDQATLVAALALAGSDFEDDLQIACA
jgi:PIN domain-containing protein